MEDGKISRQKEEGDEIRLNRDSRISRTRLNKDGKNQFVDGRRQGIYDVRIEDSEVSCRKMVGSDGRW